MKTISLRSLAREAPMLTEAVLVTHDRRVVGRYTPNAFEADVAAWMQDPVFKAEHDKAKEELVTEQPIKKAIEPDKAKPDQGGQLRKGLGPLPGESRDPYKEFRPVPKTKK